MELTDERRTQLKKIVIICLIAFLLVYGIYLYFKYFNHENNPKEVKEYNSIIFKQPNLQIFSYKETLKMYPDRVLMHYPYFLVVKPDEFKTTIYNIDTKKKEKIVPEIVLDYFNGNTVYNKQGINTYYNDKKLGLLCDQAFIKSETDILCITRPDKNQIYNKLISINPKNLDQKVIYKSQNVLTAMYFEKENLYIGEYNFETNKSFLTVNNKSIPASDLINVIYPMNYSIYLASFKSQRNNLRGSYSILDSKKLLIEKVKGYGIAFY